MHLPGQKFYERCRENFEYHIFHTLYYVPTRRFFIYVNVALIVQLYFMKADNYKMLLHFHNSY